MEPWEIEADRKRKLLCMALYDALEKCLTGQEPEHISKLFTYTIDALEGIDTTALRENHFDEWDNLESMLTQAIRGKWER